MLAIILLLCAGSIAFVFFYPNNYNVTRLKERAGTRYWSLPSGSRIAYTLVPAKGWKQPYPVIYLHGGPSAGITDLEIETLGRFSNYGYDVYLYDQIGCGHSARLDDINEYTAERHRTDLEQIVEQLNTKKVILLGQSWGSILSALYLANNPDKVAKLVITAPAAMQPQNYAYAAIAVPDTLQIQKPALKTNLKKSFAITARSKAIEFWLRKFGKKLATDAEADQLATYNANELNKSMVCDSSHAVIAEGTEGFYAHYKTRLSLGKVQDPRPKLMTANTPVLIMKAQCDNQQWGYTTEYFDVFRNHEFAFIKNAGHNIFIEQPDEYIRTIKRFLDK